MKNNILEYIILYVIVACTALVIATLARMFTVSVGFDSFTAFIVFIVILAIQAVVYLSIHVALQNIMLPWIGNGLAKIPYFRKKIEQRQVSQIVAEPQIEEKKFEIPEDDIDIVEFKDELGEEEYLKISEAGFKSASDVINARGKKREFLIEVLGSKEELNAIVEIMKKEFEDE